MSEYFDQFAVQVSVDYASDDAHVATLNVIERNSRSREDLAMLADMFGYGTEDMRERYERGLKSRRAIRFPERSIENTA